METLKHIIRLMNKNRRTTVLLIFSLFIGLSTYILIYAKVNYHLSFDKNVPDYENIYRVVSSAYTDNVLTISQPRSQRALGETLEKNYSEVLQSGYLCGTVENHFKIGDEAFNNEKVFHCSNGLLKLFSITPLQGNTENLLTRPYTAIISESFAQKYFPNENPIGKTIFQYPGAQFEIEAIIKDLPANSHFHADFLLSFHNNMHLPPPLKENWGEFSFYTYLKLIPSADIKKLDEAMLQLTAENNHGEIASSQTQYTFQLQALASIHSKSHLKNEIEQNVRGDYLSVLKLISIYILLISVFNYIYFSHTHFLKNSVLYGVRKVFGAKSSSLFRYFLIESILIHLIALLLFVIVFTILGKSHLSFSPETSIHSLPLSFWIGCTVIIIASMIINPLVILLSVNRKKTLTLLSPQRMRYSSGYSYRQLLTIVQFAIILFLLSSIIGIQKQLTYLKSRDTGIDISNKLVIKSPANFRRSSNRFVNLDAFEQEITKLSGVENLSISNNVPGDVPSFNFGVSVGESAKSIKTAIFIANQNFINAFNIKMIAGKGFFSQGVSSTTDNSKGSIINKTCLKQLGYDNPELIIGKAIKLADASGLDNFETIVAGVCDDFNFSSAKENPGPVILIDWTQSRMVGRYTLNLNPKIDKINLLAEVKEQFMKTFPNYSFDYFWLDDHYNQQFTEEDTVESNLKAFALVAIILGILSLFSMVWHMSVSRTKEIGIRKINGAKLSEIHILLNKDYIKSVVIAFVIATPIAWYAMNKWLENFAYKTELSWWIFALAGLLALGIALITVSWQSWKAATRNPVEALRYE
jgi:putative ABC transport system permease protein